MICIPYRLWREDQGVLTFEWILLITVLVIGIVGALSAMRDAVISELGDLSFAISSLDQSYTILTPMIVCVHTNGPIEPIPLGAPPPCGCKNGGSDSRFDDNPEYVAACRPAEAPISPDASDVPEGP